MTRLAIFAPNWLGDAVMALPALADVRRAWPEARLIVAARRSVIRLFEAVPIVDEVLPLGGDGEVERVRAGRFDAALLLPNSFAVAWLARRAGVPERWGYRGDGRRLLLTRAVARPSRRGHQAEYYQELVRRLGMAVGPIAPQIRPSEAALRRARTLLAEGGWDGAAPLVGVAPGAAFGHAKRWPPDRFAAVIRALSAAGVATVVVGSAADADAGREIERALAGATLTAPCVDLVGRTSLPELFGTLALCRAVVTNDSGAMHVAAALGVPVTAIFGPTDERVTSPLPTSQGTRAHAVLARQVWCRPCMLRECPIDHRCMTRIPPEEVLAALWRQLA
ncbi:MAG: lipopolysaccharide heptosyltransferase II [Acidobacteriota bacterium]|nr:lipopolysaccharide heptosyltransferase II [Acidobacteriota bacterium]